MWIDNSSGHYKPQKENLITAVGLLAGDGANFDEAKVGVYEFDNRNNQTLNVFRGPDLLARPRSATAIWSV
jgi:hypothetical protein